MSASILGYSVEALTDMYRLYVFEKKTEPSDVHEILNFWWNYVVRTPRDSLKIAARLSEAQDVNTTPCIKMIERFIEMTYNQRVSLNGAE